MVTGEGTFVGWAGWTDDGMGVDNSMGADWEDLVTLSEKKVQP